MTGIVNRSLGTKRGSGPLREGINAGPGRTADHTAYGRDRDGYKSGIKFEEIQGIQVAQRNWAWVATHDVAYFHLGAEASASFILWLSWTGWWSHESGSRIIAGSANTHSGGGSPGSITNIHSSHSSANDLSFAIATDDGGISSKGRKLQVTGTNNYGPTVTLMMMCSARGKWYLYNGETH